jgi:hypothetical protein
MILLLGKAGIQPKTKRRFSIGSIRLGFGFRRFAGGRGRSQYVNNFIPAFGFDD